MSQKFLVRALYDAGSAYGKNPILLVSSLFLMSMMLFLRKGSQNILPHLQTNTSNVIWTITAALIILFILAISFSALLTISADIVRNRKPSLAHMWHGTRNRSISVFMILVLTTLASIAVFFLSLGAGNFSLNILNWSNTQAFIVATTFLVTGTLGGLLFLAFSTVISVISTVGPLSSICASARLVKRNYFSVLLASLILFSVTKFIQFIAPELLAELIYTLIVLPYLALFLSFFVKYSSP